MTPKKGNKLHKQDDNQKTLLLKVDALELEGVNITRGVKLVKDCIKLSDLKKHYILWVYDIQDFVNLIASRPEKSFFFEDDYVFQTIDRGCGIDFNDEFCQKLLKDIFEETKKKLQSLRKVKEELTKKIQEKEFFNEKLKEEIKFTTKENACYLKEGDKEIKIGKLNTRKCKLLECLFNPLGTAKTVDVVCGDIHLNKDNQNRELYDEYGGKTKKESIIRTTGKEIQRILSSKKSKYSLAFHIQDRRVWLTID